MKDPTTRRSRYLKFSLPKFCDVTWTYLLIILDFYDNPKLYFSWQKSLADFQCYIERTVTILMLVFQGNLVRKYTHRRSE